MYTIYVNKLWNICFCDKFPLFILVGGKNKNKNKKEKRSWHFQFQRLVGLDWERRGGGGIDFLFICLFIYLFCFFIEINYCKNFYLLPYTKKKKKEREKFWYQIVLFNISKHLETMSNNVMASTDIFYSLPDPIAHMKLLYIFPFLTYLDWVLFQEDVVNCVYPGHRGYCTISRGSHSTNSANELRQYIFVNTQGNGTLYSTFLHLLVSRNQFQMWFW